MSWVMWSYPFLKPIVYSFLETLLLLVTVTLLLEQLGIGLKCLLFLHGLGNSCSQTSFFFWLCAEKKALVNIACHSCSAVLGFWGFYCTDFDWCLIKRKLRKACWLVRMMDCNCQQCHLRTTWSSPINRPFFQLNSNQNLLSKFPRIPGLQNKYGMLVPQTLFTAYNQKEKAVWPYACGTSFYKRRLWELGRILGNFFNLLMTFSCHITITDTIPWKQKNKAFGAVMWIKVSLLFCYQLILFL